MSLAVPYLLRAALEMAPHLQIPCGPGRLVTVRQADTASAVAARRLLNGGARPGDRAPAVDAIEQLACARAGVVIGDGAGAASGPAGEGCDLDLLETRIWSETPLAKVGGRVITHGDYLAALMSGSPAEPILAPLSAVLRPMLALSER